MQQRSRAPKGSRSSLRPPAEPRGRDEIVEALEQAAMRLFDARGPAAVSLREIAREAHVTYSLVHRHFASRDALLQAVAARYAARNIAMTAGIDGFPEALRQVILDVTAGQSQYVRLLTWCILQNLEPTPAQAAMPALKRLVELYRQHQEEAARRGTLSDDGDNVDVAWTLVVSLLYGWQLFGDLLLASLRAEQSRTAAVEQIRRLVSEILHLSVAI